MIIHNDHNAIEPLKCTVRHAAERAAAEPAWAKKGRKGSPLT